MASFVASTPVDMATLPDLLVLISGSTTWTNSVTAFTATSGNGSVEIAGDGNAFLPFPGTPTVGALNRLQVSYETPSAHLAYAINGIGLTLQYVLSHIHTDGSPGALATMLDGSDLVLGSGGADTLHGYAGDDTIYGNGGNDYIVGDAGNDHLFGGAGYDLLQGGPGDDVLSGGTGIDNLDGGDGSDTASFFEMTKGVVVYLTDTFASTYRIGGKAAGQLVDIENVQGGHAGDRITGNAQDNGLFGNGGNDILSGWGGNDRLVGGPGNDTLTGGPGADHFVFSAALNPTTNVDRITDFSPAADRIDLSHAVFATAGAAGKVLAASAFYKGAHAHDASDRVIYNPVSGFVYYDSNGSGAGHEVHFATLAHNLAVTHADFLII